MITAMKKSNHCTALKIIKINPLKLSIKNFYDQLKYLIVKMCSPKNLQRISALAGQCEVKDRHARVTNCAHFQWIVATLPCLASCAPHILDSPSRCSREMQECQSVIFTKMDSHLPTSQKTAEGVLSETGFWT